MAKKKFLRTNTWLYSRLGVRRKNKQIYRKARGGENKLRLKRKGRLRNIAIGFRSEKKTRDLINGLRPVLVHNINELKIIKKHEIGVIAGIGRKKRIEIANFASANKIRLLNFRPDKFLAKIEEEKKKIKEEKSKKEEKKKEKVIKEAEKKEENIETKVEENKK